MAKRLIKISLSLVTLLLIFSTTSCSDGNGAAGAAGVNAIEESFEYDNGTNLSETNDWEILPDTL